MLSSLTFLKKSYLRKTILFKKVGSYISHIMDIRKNKKRKKNSYTFCITRTLIARRKKCACFPKCAKKKRRQVQHAARHPLRLEEGGLGLFALPPLRLALRFTLLLVLLHARERGRFSLQIRLSVMAQKEKLLFIKI